MNKILLFDFDGTLADSFENFLEIVNTISEKYNLPTPSRSELEELRMEEPRAIIKRLKIPFYKIPFIARDMKRMQHQHIATIKPFKGLPEVLKELKNKGCMLGIITSNGKDNVESFIKKNNIDLFDYIHSDTSLFGKDKAIRNFLKQHGVSNDEVMYVGDEIRDIQACKKVGVPIISVTWGFNSKQGLTKYHPDFVINTPDELLSLVN